MNRDFADRITWIAVADGQKAVILRNDDTDQTPSLNVLRVDEIDNPAARDQAAGPPGRMNDGRAGSARKSSFQETDFHLLEKERFAKDFAARLNKAALAGNFDRLLIIAPPATLGELRTQYHLELKKRLIGEIDRDLTNHPVEEIEQHVAAALKPDEPSPS